MHGRDRTRPWTRKGGRPSLSRAIAISLLLGIAALFLGASGEAAHVRSQKTTVTLWNSADTPEFSEAFQKKFNATHPGIELKITLFPESTFNTKVDLALTTGSVPDLVGIHPGSERWMKAGKLLTIPDVYRSVAKAGIPIASITGGLRKGCTWGGKLYCIGSSRGFIAMYYNKDMFRAAGVPFPPRTGYTPLQLHTAACKLTKNGVWGVAMGDPESVSPFELWFSPNGRKIVGYSNSAATIRYYEQINSIYDDKCAPSTGAVDAWVNGVDVFAQGKLAMVVSDWESVAKIEKAGIRYGVVPSIHPSNVPAWSYTWWDGTAVVKDSKHPQEAKKVLEYLATQGQYLRAKVFGDAPASSVVAKKTGYLNSAGRKEAYEQASRTTARTWSFMPDRFDVLSPINSAFAQVRAGRSVRSVLDKASAAAQKKLDAAWKRWEAG
jgi:ABC-type glycerol-3-phosphate transport system substrate-binding protein